jgi:hypothetical protein
MTVGDFVNIRPSDRGNHVERLVAKLDPRIAADTLVSQSLFSNVGGPTSARSRWLRLVGIIVSGLLVGVVVIMLAELLGIRQLFGIIAGVVVAILVGGILFLINSGFAGGKQSLIAVMETHHDVGLQPTATGFEAIGIPFPHVIMLMGRERFEYRTALQTQATATFNKRWQDYVDPLVGLRARALVSQRVADDELVAFFGTGIFAPRAGERPVGRVDIRLHGGAHVIQPSLPDGTPAGLYRGQSALTFSTSLELTPATIDAVSGISGRFCLRPNMGSAEHGIYVLDWDPAPGDSTMKPARDRIEPLPAGFDAAFRVSFPDTEFDLCVIDDARPSRLLHAPPAGGGLAIVGVIEPLIDGQAPDRWWIDLDDNGRLIASAMRPAKRSLVCHDGRLAVWDWTMPGAPARHTARLESLKTPEGNRNVLIAQPGRPFGWLALPARSVPVTYAPGQMEGFELDWLDFSGAVEDVMGRGERLGAWMHRGGRGCMLPGIERAPGDEALLVMPADENEYHPGWRGAWHSGMRIMCDALLLEVVEGGPS